MGRQLGTFLDEDELDRPDLNKCPDCGCFFADLYCPLCGKECPEEFRAGNRKPVRHKRRRSSGGTGRVTFIEWYHNWWFIILMLFFMPIVGIILLFTSPHSKRAKITVVAIGLAYTVLSSYGWLMFSGFSKLLDKPVNTRLSREEYIAACETVNPEEFYRTPDIYGGKFVTMTVTVVGKVTDSEVAYGNGKYPTYYVCRNAAGTCEILIRDCLQDGSYNLIVGDTVAVYGEGTGYVSIYGIDGNLYGAPCLNVAYLTSLDRAV